MQKFSRQIVQEEKLRLEPHLISTVVQLPLDCGCHCGTDQNNQSGIRKKRKTPEGFGLPILPQAVNKQSNKYISRLLSPGTTASVASHARNCTMRSHQTKGDLRFEYEYEIKYENDFSIPLCRLPIIRTHTHFIPWTTLSAKNQHEEMGLWKHHWFENRKLYSYSISYS